MKTHNLKSWPEFFQGVLDGRKKHELRRKDDRKFEVGDILILQEYDPVSNEYTGREVGVEVTYITSNEHPCALSADALNINYCILSIRPIND